MSSDPHQRTKSLQRSSDDDDDDPVERLLKKSGCLELHYKVQECMVDHKDWRICQPHVQKFRECIEESQKRKKKE